MNRKGINRANPIEYEIYLNKILLESKDYSNNDPCVFISHKKEDSKAARLVADYVKDAGLDVFFDEEEEELQDPEIRNDPERITGIITNAIGKGCSHMICIVSKKTKESWWVPFEIGFAWEKIKTRNFLLFIINPIDRLPEFLRKIPCIETVEEMDDFLKEAGNTQRLLYEKSIQNFSRFIDHPLKSILKS